MEKEKKKINIKIIIVIVAIIGIVAIVGIVIFTANKGTEESKTLEVTYKIGDTVSSDTFEFTLDDLKPTVALDNVSANNNVPNENYFNPKEYDSKKDGNNIFVAPKGHTLIWYQYTLKNIDRKSYYNKRCNISEVEYNNNKCKLGFAYAGPISTGRSIL